METTKLISTLKAELASLRAKGHETLDIKALENYLELLGSDSGESMEMVKLKFQGELAHYDATAKQNIEMFKSVIESGKEALNALVLINGGAVIALLGFMSAVISKGLPQALGARLTIPLLYFGIGVLMGAVGFAVRYLSQASYSGQKMKLGTGLTIFAIGLAISGYTLFGCGVYGAYRAFSMQFAF